MTNRDTLLSALFIAAPHSRFCLVHLAVNMCHHQYPSVQMLSESFFICIIQAVKPRVFMPSLIQSASKVGSVTFQSPVLLKQQENQANEHMFSLLHTVKGFPVCLNSLFTTYQQLVCSQISLGKYLTCRNLWSTKSRFYSQFTSHP